MMTFRVNPSENSFFPDKKVPLGVCVSLKEGVFTAKRPLPQVGKGYRWISAGISRQDKNRDGFQRGFLDRIKIGTDFSGDFSTG